MNDTGRMALLLHDGHREADRHHADEWRRAQAKLDASPLQKIDSTPRRSVAWILRLTARHA